MGIDETIGPVVERLQRSVSVETVYGEPLESHSLTAIPLAKVAYGFGAGGGIDAEEVPNADDEVE